MSSSDSCLGCRPALLGGVSEQGAGVQAGWAAAAPPPPGHLSGRVMRQWFSRLRRRPSCVAAGRTWAIMGEAGVK